MIRDQLYLMRPVIWVMWLAVSAFSADLDPDYQTGINFFNGKGVAKDYTKAHEHFERAAARGHAEAQGALGAMLATGTGCTKDESRALHMLELASSAGVPLAIFNLGVMRLKGQGCDPDIQRGIELITTAAETGLKPAMLRLAEIYYLGEGDAVPRDLEKALPWVRKSAENGDAWAQNALGTMLEHGQATPIDREEARTWYENAALQNFHLAQGNLGLWYRSGPVEDQDDAMAYAWYSLGAPHVFAAKQQYALLDATLPEAIKTDGRKRAADLKQKLTHQPSPGVK